VDNLEAATCGFGTTIFSAEQKNEDIRNRNKHYIESNKAVFSSITGDFRYIRQRIPWEKEKNSVAPTYDGRSRHRGLS
jgi:hypothetical protein